MAQPRTVSRWLALGLLVLAALIALAAYVWRDDIAQSSLDPKEPFQTYQPPSAPDYSVSSAWYLSPPSPSELRPTDPPVDVFFVSPTTYDGGRHWNAPIYDPAADQFFRRTIAPNYVGPFVRVGRIFAPRYRQASLYTQLTLREDAIEARRFAYSDVARAFIRFRDTLSLGRPFVLVGVEQGGLLATRLLAEEIASRPDVRARLVAAYLIETAVPVDGLPIRSCGAKAQTECVAAWASVTAGDLARGRDIRDRSLVWGGGGTLESLGGRALQCFNPLLGAVGEQDGPARLNLGAVNATGLEWGARPAFLTRQVGARCEAGVLQVTRLSSSALRVAGGWADRKKISGFNVFYGDLEADAMARSAAWRQAAADLNRRPWHPAANRTAPAAP